MFQIEDKYKIANSNDLPFITQNYTILHFDEFPILFTGSNDDGDKIIGSLLYEDTETDTFRYTHAIVKDLDLKKFLRRQISYRALIATAKVIFVIDKDINDNILSMYCIGYDKLPEDYLPLDSAYCPQFFVFDTGMEEHVVILAQQVVRNNRSLWVKEAA